MPTPSDEEKAAADKAAADKAAADKAVAEQKEKDDLGKKDTTGFTAEQMADYIEKLKDENAKRRIASKKLQDEIDKQKTNQTKSDSELADMKLKLEGHEKAQKEADDKEKSEIERLTSQLGEAEKTIQEKDILIAEKDSKLSKSKQKLAKRDRESLVSKLSHQLSFDFSSDFERKGFLDSISNTDSQTGEFSLNDEEVIMKVKEFAKDRKDPPKTPGSGPVNKATETPLAEEIKALLAKDELTDEDKKRLDELLEEVG